METLLHETNPPWAVTSEKVDAAVRRTIGFAHPKKIYLFGSCVHAKPDGSPPRDMDMLVVVDDTVGRIYEESARIRGALGDIHMPMDIVVARESELERFAQVPGYIYREVLRNGRLVYAA